MKTFVSVFFTLCWAWSSIGQGLYVGTNYHPHDDKDLAKVERDIGLMKAAGFTVVRMGHLAWDSYEPSEGQFDFAWFDQVMDLMDKAGIKVILDIAVRPAPLWLHNVLLTIADEGGRPVFEKIAGGNKRR
jgi:beta-galactosidase